MVEPLVVREAQPIVRAIYDIDGPDISPDFGEPFIRGTDNKFAVAIAVEVTRG